MKYTGTRSALALAVFAAITMEAAPALAQAGALEEVVVTARKRSENLQDVPMSISAFSSKDLQNAQIDNLVEVGRMSPNVQVNETSGLVAGGISVFMRGIGNNPGYDQGIGIYIDDVYSERTTGGMLELLDVERIEILKGPQGHLYGRNTIGGAIRYITRDPSNEPTGSVEVKFGSDSYNRIKASFSGPLSDNLSGSFAVTNVQRDGWQKNTVDDREFWDKDMQAARGALLWKASDAVTVKLNASYVKDSSMPVLPNRIAFDPASIGGLTAIAYTADAFFSSFGLTGVSPGLPLGPHNTSIPTDVDSVSTAYEDFDKYGFEQTNVDLKVEWELSDSLSLKSITALRDMDSTQVYDFDTSEQLWIQTLRDGLNTNDVSQELQLNYSSDNIQAVAGLYYLDGEFDQDGGGTPQTPYLRGVLNQTGESLRDSRDVTSKSIYGNVDWDVSEDWQVSIGARWTEDEKTQESLTRYQRDYYALVVSSLVAGGRLPMAIKPGMEGAVAAAMAQMNAFFATQGNGDFVAFVPGASQAVSVTTDEALYATDSWTEFTPSARIKYSLSENTMVYAGYSQGFKAGGFNANTTNNESYDPETVATISVGIKSTLADGAIRFNAEYFSNDYEDKQMQTIILTQGDLVALTRNVGKVTSQGFEADLTWQTPIEGLLINANVGYLDQSVDEFPEQQADGSFINKASTTELGYAPEWTGQIRALYRTAMAGGNLTISGDASFQDEMYLNSPIDLTKAIKTAQKGDDYWTYNAMAAYTTADEKWRFAVEGKNLSDERQLINTFDISVMANGGYTAPRTWAISAEYSF
jgi:iron complex outermembrane receptor protein